MKKIFEISDFLGRTDGQAPKESRIMEDTPEIRKKIIEEYEPESNDYEFTNNKMGEFIDGKTNEIFIKNSQDEYGEPMGTHILILSYEEKKRLLIAQFEEDIDDLNKNFDVKDFNWINLFYYREIDTITFNLVKIVREKRTITFNYFNHTLFLKNDNDTIMNEYGIVLYEEVFPMYIFKRIVLFYNLNEVKIYYSEEKHLTIRVNVTLEGDGAVITSLEEVEND